MPLAIILDVSLSMARPVNTSPEEAEECLRKHLAIHGINILLDHLTTHSKLEFVALVLFNHKNVKMLLIVIMKYFQF